jgi:hypothetical protein
METEDVEFPVWRGRVVNEVLDIVFWKWKRPGYRSSFDANTVHVGRNMFARHLKVPHRVTCVTDDPTGLDSDIRVVDLRALPSYRWFDVPNPSNAKNPSCYTRLFLFSAAARDVLGARVVSVDLDVVLTQDVTPLFVRDEDFVIWGGQALGPGRLGSYNWFNGSVMLLRTGTRTKVYDTFDPAVSPAKANEAGCRGSDQGWIAYCLGHKEATFGIKDGIHSFRNHIIPNKGRLLPDTRLVSFHGQYDPWHASVQISHPWVKEHYR